MTSVAAELIFENLSREIIGAAMEVLNVLKPGLDEKLYERALILELESRGGMPFVARSGSGSPTVKNILGL